MQLYDLEEHPDAASRRTKRKIELIKQSIKRLQGYITLLQRTMGKKVPMEENKTSGTSDYDSSSSSESST